MEDKQEPVYRLRGVNYWYLPGVPALQGIDLDIHRGEKLVLLGANGSGKSTLLKLLGGLAFAREGELSAFGRALSETALSREAFARYFRRQVGFVFQHSEAQLFNPTVRDEIAFGLLQLDLSPRKVEERVQSILDMLELNDLRDRPPYRLSGGEAKKLALGAVLVVNPQVLLLDEPTNGLDPRTRRWLLNLLARLSRAGKTIITATHDLNSVPEIAERVAVFNEDHQLVARGTPAEILADKDLLVRVNLVDPHYHLHQYQATSHLYAHDS